LKVVAENITRRFGKSPTPAVDGAGFEAPSGRITTLLGPSGSGKTTMLRIIAGLEQPDVGRVIVGEEDVTFVPVRNRGLGFVFQSFALFGHMTVEENIAFGLKTRSFPKEKIKSRVEEMLSYVQLEGLNGRFPSQLSGGQQQRVGFARALAPSPKVLLLDEPFAALDTRVRIELRAWLKKLHEVTRLTTILVTHDQEEALELSDWIVVMDKGRVQQAGTPEDIYERPATAFVASFLGTPNVIRSRVNGGMTSVGSLQLSVPPQFPEGAEVRAVLRPHELRLHTAHSDGTETQPGPDTYHANGRVLGISNLGAHVRLRLDLGGGEAVTVQVSKREFDSLKISAGDVVFVEPENSKVFLDDYAI